MTVKELAQTLSLRTFALPKPDRVVEGGYAGDLLSWVMGRAKENAAWLTIMSNQNVAAVSLMADLACVVLTEGVVPDENLLAKAQEQGVNLLGTDAPTYETALRLGDALK